jgi:hypothetical protein
MFEVVSGCGTVDQQGLYTAPASPCAARIKVTDADGLTAEATVLVVSSSGPLTIVPAAITLTISQSVTFSAAGGEPPYVFSLDTGVGSVAGNGVYTAPASPGSAVVRVTDDAGDTRTATVTVTGPAPPPLTLVPTSVTLFTRGRLTFSAFGGSGSYTFSVVGNGTIDSSGNYVAPGDPTVDTVQADDGATSVSATVTVIAPLSITPNQVTVPEGDSVVFSAAGGVPPYGFTMKSGTGSVTGGGGYTTGGPGIDQVQVEDSGGNLAVATVVVTAVQPLQISPATVTVLAGQSLTFTATGGVPPYYYQLFSGSGSVTDGGLYTAGAAGPATVRVSDSLGNTADASVTVQSIPALAILPASTTVLEGGAVGFAATGGIPPYTFSMKSGGGTVTASGDYTAGAAGTDEVQVQDDNGSVAVATVVVQAVRELVINPSSITLLDGDSTTFTAAGGAPPYVFSVASGPGSVSSGGLYATAGTGSAVVRVTDQNGDRRDAVVTIVSFGPLTISPSTVTLAVSGTTQFTATGGKPPYSFSITTGGGSLSPLGSTAVEYASPSSPDTATIELRDALSSTVTATANVLGLSCGQTVPETEPNDDDAPPWNEVSDLGIVLVSGCQVTITGTSDIDSASDTFKISTGSASYVNLLVEWQTGSKVFDIYVRRPDGSIVASATTAGTQSENLAWVVGEENADRYIELAVVGSPGAAYTLTVSAF